PSLPLGNSAYGWEFLVSAGVEPNTPFYGVQGPGAKILSAGGFPSSLNRLKAGLRLHPRANTLSSGTAGHRASRPTSTSQRGGGLANRAAGVRRRLALLQNSPDLGVGGHSTLVGFLQAHGAATTSGYLNEVCHLLAQVLK